MIPEHLREQIVRLHLVEHWSVNQVSKHLGVHHGTVRRALRDSGLSVQATERQSILDPYLPLLQQQLESIPTIPASSLYRMLVERGYEGSESHLRAVVARMRPRKAAEAYLRLHSLPAEQGQVDWGAFGTHQVGKATRRLSAFVMVLSYSRMPYVRFFYDQQMGNFLQGHVEAFEFFCGVPRVLLYDNLKSVVLDRQDRAIRFHPQALQLAEHYRFEPRPVGVRKGNEKGRVERTIRYLRTSFWPGIEFRDLDDLNEQARRWCQQIAGARKHPDDPSLTVEQAWQQERSLLLPLPPEPFVAEQVTEVRVGKQPYVRFDRNDYSVPHDHVRRTLTVRATDKQVRILDGDELIATHPRSYDKKQTIEDPNHVEALVEHKRQARQHSGLKRLTEMVPSAEPFVHETGQRGHNVGSAVAALLRLVDSWGAGDVEQSIQEAMKADSYHVAAVTQSLNRRLAQVGICPEVVVRVPNDERLANLHVAPHDLSSYDLDDEQEAQA